MSEAEGVGDIFTGGIVAREVEHKGGAHPARSGHASGDGTCLNCGTPVVGNFCAECGQSAHVHKTMVSIGHDILHGVFHFEGKFWATLPLLVRRPGALTRRYIEGERARFVSPMALFLFSVFLLFAAVNRIAMPDVAGVAQGLATARAQISDEADKAQHKVDDLKEKRGDRLSDDPKAPTADLDAKIADAEKEVAALKAAAARMPANAKDAARVGQVKAGDKTYNFDLATGVKSMDIDTGVAALDTQLHHIQQNPDLYAYKLKMASYKYSWALIPISVPLIWLLFLWRPQFGAYDHAIFAIYSLGFMTLLAVGLIGLYLLGVPSGLLVLTGMIAPPIHMYKQLKGAYRLRRFSAAWRTFALLVMTSIAGSLFFALILWLESD